MVAIASSSSSSSEEHGNEEVQDGRMARQVVLKNETVALECRDFLSKNKFDVCQEIMLKGCRMSQDMAERYCVPLPGISLEEKRKKRKRKR